MQRSEWLEHVREMTERLYDQVSPQYWRTFGFYPNETHLAFLQRFMAGLPAHGRVLSAACGAGRYDGLLLEAGLRVVGIDQSAGMLERARSHFPEAEYRKCALQQLDFQAEFDGATCVDALEHLPPEDWPDLFQNLAQALKPGGSLYFTVELAEPQELQKAYSQAQANGLPVVYGEVAHELEAAFNALQKLGNAVEPGELAARAAYHYYPAPEQVRKWASAAWLELQEQGTGNDYEHFIVRKIEP